MRSEITMDADETKNNQGATESQNPTIISKRIIHAHSRHSQNPCRAPHSFHIDPSSSRRATIKPHLPVVQFFWPQQPLLLWYRHASYVRNLLILFRVDLRLFPIKSPAIYIFERVLAAKQMKDR